MRKRDRPRSAGLLGRDKRKGGGALTVVLAVLLVCSFLSNLQVYLGCLRSLLSQTSSLHLKAGIAWQVWMEARGSTASPTAGDHLSFVKHPVPKLRNMVLVACHAVFIGRDYSKAEDQDAWLLMDYQKVPEAQIILTTKLCPAFLSSLFALQQPDTIGSTCSYNFHPRE